MASTTSPIVRPSRLPARCSNSKTQSSDRSLSTPKISKLPIRTTGSVKQQQTLVKKSNIPTLVATKTEGYSLVPPMTNTTITKTIRPPLVVQSPSNKVRSRSITTVDSNTTKTLIPSSLNKRTRTTIETITSSSKKSVKSTGPSEQMNSTSSESSIEEQQQMDKLLPVVQDEGYSTWSSSDVKDDVTTSCIKENGTDERQRNIGFVKNWLDTSTKQCSERPVKEGMN
jgi:hypothetical protein